MRSKMLFVVVVCVVALAARSASAQTQSYLPQVVNGQFSEGSFRTTFIAFNNTDSTVLVTLQLTSDSGGAFPVTITGLGAGSSFNFTLAPGATSFLQTDGSGALAAGGGNHIQRHR